MKRRPIKRLVALAATAALTVISGISVALSSHTATAASVKPAPVVHSFAAPSVQLYKKIATEEVIASIPVVQHYTVKSMDTLAKISAKVFGSAGAWPALWYANRHIVKNPDSIYTGQVLTVPTSKSVPSWMLKQAIAATGQVSAPQSGGSVTVAAVQPAGSLQAYALSLLGGDSGQFSCLNAVIMIESSWNVTASNASGAYGIPQALPGSKMSAAGSDWATDGYTQLRWMIKMYIPGTYGTACGALAHEHTFGWY